MDTPGATAFEAADQYLVKLGFRWIHEVDAAARLLLARAFMEELPKLECLGHDKFTEARIGLVSICNIALDSFDITAQKLPDSTDLAEKMRQFGCHNKNARESFNNILAKLNAGIT